VVLAACSRTGVDEHTRLVDLTGPEIAQLCDYETSIGLAGSAGFTCDNGRSQVPYERCMDGWDAPCEATVGQLLDCYDARRAQICSADPSGEPSACVVIDTFACEGFIGW
jgi:hypothetical protein